MADLKATMQRIYDEMFNQGNLDVIDELLADDFVEHQELPPGIPQGKGAPRAYTEMFRSAFPDFHMAVEEMLQDGNKVITRVNVSGTHRGEFMGIPPTNNKFDVSAIDIVEFRDGQAIGHWGVMEEARMMQQLGIGGPPG
jgi:steroid delta-isomerase-like uncharacterized protein